MLYSVKGSGESAKDLTTMSPADYELAAGTWLRDFHRLKQDGFVV